MSSVEKLFNSFDLNKDLLYVSGGEVKIWKSEGCFGPIERFIRVCMGQFKKDTVAYKINEIVLSIVNSNTAPNLDDSTDMMMEKLSQLSHRFSKTSSKKLEASYLLESCRASLLQSKKKTEFTEVWNYCNFSLELERVGKPSRWEEKYGKLPSEEMERLKEDQWTAYLQNKEPDSTKRTEELKRRLEEGVRSIATQRNEAHWRNVLRPKYERQQLECGSLPRGYCARCATIPEFERLVNAWLKLDRGFRTLDITWDQKIPEELLEGDVLKNLKSYLLEKAAPVLRTRFNLELSLGEIEILMNSESVRELSENLNKSILRCLFSRYKDEIQAKIIEAGVQRGAKGCGMSIQCDDKACRKVLAIAIKRLFHVHSVLVPQTAAEGLGGGLDAKTIWKGQRPCPVFDTATFSNDYLTQAAQQYVSQLQQRKEAPMEEQKAPPAPARSTSPTMAERFAGWLKQA